MSKNYKKTKAAKAVAVNPQNDPLIWNGPMTKQEREQSRMEYFDEVINAKKPWISWATTIGHGLLSKFIADANSLGYEYILYVTDGSGDGDGTTVYAVCAKYLVKCWMDTSEFGEFSRVQLMEDAVKYGFDDSAKYFLPQTA